MATKSAPTVSVIVYRLERLNNSVNGNPRYRIITDEGMFITSSDYGFVYGIEDGWRGRNCRTAVLTLTRAGRVQDLKYIS